MIITAFNTQTDDLEKTFLQSPESAGTTSHTVKKKDRFAANDRIMLGEMGGEKTEVVTVSSVSGGDTIVTGATVFAHDADTPVYKLQFDQVKFYRATSESGTYSVISTVNMDVDNGGKTTSYDDTTGISSNWYKISLYHSVSTVESQLTDPIPAPGYKRNQVGYLIDEILQEVSDPTEQYVSRTEILGFFNDCSDDLLTYASRPFDFLHARTTLTRTANTAYIDFPTDSNGDQTIWKFDRLDYVFTDSTTTPAIDRTYTLFVDAPDYFRNRYSDNTIDSTTVSDTIGVVTLDTAVNRFRFNPPAETTGAAVFYLYYWKYFTRLDSEGDEFETPTLRPYKLFAKAMYYRKRAATEPGYNQLADRLTADYSIERGRLTMHNRKDKGTPRSFTKENSTTRSFRR